MVVSTITNKILLFLLLLLIFFISCSNESKLVKKAKSIKKGMTKQEVGNIMGVPDKRDFVYSIPLYKERFYYSISPPIFSEDIIVWFDSTGYVGQISFPKGTGE